MREIKEGNRENTLRRGVKSRGVRRRKTQKQVFTNFKERNVYREEYNVIRFLFLWI